MGRNRSDILARDLNGNKQCVRCENWYPEADYYKRGLSADGYREFCRYCASKEDSVRRHHFGMPAYLALAEAQNNQCAICKVSTPAPDRMWTIDHDHNCCPGTYSCGSCIRGLICRKCNMALGLFQDSESIIKSAAVYLGKH